MIQSLQLGPFAVPITPLFAVLAVILGLDMAARYGRRLGLNGDDVWNTGMIAIVAGLLGARVWNVLQFWEVYGEEPQLILSLRPSGFVWSAGIVIAIVAAYAFMIFRALDPVRVVVTFLVGGALGWMVQSISNFLTGNLLGELTNVPWAMGYYDELRHPVAMYELLGAALLLLLALVWGEGRAPGRLAWGMLLGWSVLFLVTRALVAEPNVVAGMRTVQLAALLIGLLACLRLSHNANTSSSSPEQVTEEQGNTAK